MVVCASGCISHTWPFSRPLDSNIKQQLEKLRFKFSFSTHGNMNAESDLSASVKLLKTGTELVAISQRVSNHKSKEEELYTGH